MIQLWFITLVCTVRSSNAHSLWSGDTTMPHQDTLSRSCLSNSKAERGQGWMQITPAALHNHVSQVTLYPCTLALAIKQQLNTVSLF